MLNDRPSLPGPREWARQIAQNAFERGEHPRSWTGPSDTVECARHDERVRVELERLWIKRLFG